MAPFLGTSAILVNKLFIKQVSVVPHSYHAWVGALALLLVAAQVWMGVRKHAVVVATGEKTLKFHGKLGNVIYLLCLVAILLGVLSFFTDAETPPSPTPLAWLLASAVTVLGVLIFASHGPAENLEAADATVEETEPIVNSI